MAGGRARSSTPSAATSIAKYKTITLNNGVDIAAAIGTPVHSVGDGVVDLVQWISGYGQTVIVNHGRGFYTIYAHLSSVSVGEGDRVTPGQLIGASGDTGSLKGPCLHFEVREGGAAQDPQTGRVDPGPSGSPVLRTPSRRVRPRRGR